MAAHMAGMEKTRTALRATLGPAYDAPIPGVERADLTRGATIFAENCAICHGATGHGDGAAGKDLDPPPSDMTDAMHARFYSDAGRIQVIRSGSPGTAMPAWAGALDEQAVLDVYAFVASLRPATP